uniref:Uncharacterized protein n=1 Tax=Glossina brevipalpis TaxID=37001 RepID=A0A1A9WDR4_9MUSC
MEHHERHECLQYPVKCKYARIGCQWTGARYQASHHEGNCEYLTKSSHEIITILEALAAKEVAQKEMFRNLTESMSLEKMIFTDLHMIPYFHENEIFYGTKQFPAFDKMWMIRAKINNYKCSDTSAENSFSYQLILKSGTVSSMIVKFVALKGPYSNVNISPQLYRHDFLPDNLQSQYCDLPIVDITDSTQLLADRNFSIQQAPIEPSTSGVAQNGNERSVSSNANVAVNICINSPGSSNARTVDADGPPAKISKLNVASGSSHILHNGLINALRCGICFGLRGTRMYLCKEGHLKCDLCFKQLLLDAQINNYLTKSSHEIITILEALPAKEDTEKKMLKDLIESMNLEKMIFTDLEMIFYCDENETFYGTNQFPAFDRSWVIKAKINNYKCSDTSAENSFSYQLILKSGTVSSMNVKFVALKGPYSNIKISPRLYRHDFLPDNRQSQYCDLPLVDITDSIQLLADRKFSIRIMMFLLN